MQFGTDQSGGVQCSVVRLRQSEVQCCQVQYSPLTCSPVQSSPVLAVQSTLVRSSPFSSVQSDLVNSRPILLSPVQFHSAPSS